MSNNPRRECRPELRWAIDPQTGDWRRVQARGGTCRNCYAEYTTEYPRQLYCNPECQQQARQRAGEFAAGVGTWSKKSTNVDFNLARNRGAYGNRKRTPKPKPGSARRRINNDATAKKAGSGGVER
jgi:hypothetical protein